MQVKYIEKLREETSFRANSPLMDQALTELKQFLKLEEKLGVPLKVFTKLASPKGCRCYVICGNNVLAKDFHLDFWNPHNYPSKLGVTTNGWAFDLKEYNIKWFTTVGAAKRALEKR